MITFRTMDPGMGADEPAQFTVLHGIFLAALTGFVGYWIGRLK